jgi:hypothetical protein
MLGTDGIRMFGGEAMRGFGSAVAGEDEGQL